MLGRQDPQRGLFDAIGLPHPVSTDSFYGRMGAFVHLLFEDDDLAELVGHGLRATRYVGEAKRRLQRLWTGVVVNLERLFKLAEERRIELLGVLKALGGNRTLAMAA